jgi:hypothetical protein
MIKGTAALKLKSLQKLHSENLFPQKHVEEVIWNQQTGFPRVSISFTTAPGGAVFRHFSPDSFPQTFALLVKTAPNLKLLPILGTI